jgi:hypothetical protein
MELILGLSKYFHVPIRVKSRRNIDLLDSCNLIPKMLLAAFKERFCCIPKLIFSPRFTVQKVNNPAIKLEPALCGSLKSIT